MDATAARHLSVRLRREVAGVGGVGEHDPPDRLRARLEVAHALAGCRPPVSIGLIRTRGIIAVAADKGPSCGLKMDGMRGCMVDGCMVLGTQICLLHYFQMSKLSTFLLS